MVSRGVEHRGSEPWSYGDVRSEAIDRLQAAQARADRIRELDTLDELESIELDERHSPGLY